MRKQMVRLIPVVLAFSTLSQMVYGQAQTSNAQVAASPAAAPSVASTAQALADPFLASCDALTVLKFLTTSYSKGDWAAFQTDGRAFLDALRNKPPRPSKTTTPPQNCKTGGLVTSVTDALDYTKRYVVLTWIGAGPLGKIQVIRAAVHSPAPEPYSADLPGVTGFTEVFLASSPDAREVSLYTSTREKDPFSEQLPDFVKAIFNPLSTTIAGILGGKQPVAGREAAEVTEPKLAVTVSSVLLPIRRASVRVQSKVKDLVTPDDFRDAVATLGTTLFFDGAGRSDRARTQVTQLVTQLPVVAKASCGPPDVLPSSPSGSDLSRSKACRDALDQAIKNAFTTAGAGATEKDLAVITDVDKQFRALAVNALSTSAELDMTFKNRPLTKFTFGAGGAVITDAHLSRVRTKIDDKTGNLVSDPLTRVMTLAFVNWSPAGYDESSARISAAERVRPFFGAALTPDFGVVGGVNVLLARGIGVVGGIGWLFGKGADAAEIGQPPAAKEDPFKLAVARSVFVGISYNYK